MSELGRRLAVRGWPVALAIALAIAMFAPSPGGLQLASPDRAGVAELRAAVDALPSGSTVAIGFDPDVGTYAEIRATVRGLLAELIARDASLVMLSLTPEGRALAIGELARLRTLGVDETRLIDAGFVPGAEAALVDAVDSLRVRVARDDVVATRLATDGLAEVAMAVVIGGNDLGPRSWVEQVGTRLPLLPIVAVAPTVLLPELQPLSESGQLAGLVGTLRDGAAYRAGIPGAVPADLLEARPIGPLPILVGILVALGALAIAAGGRLMALVRSVVRGNAG